MHSGYNAPSYHPNLASMIEVAKAVDRPPGR